MKNFTLKDLLSKTKTDLNSKHLTLNLFSQTIGSHRLEYNNSGSMMITQNNIIEEQSVNDLYDFLTYTSNVVSIEDKSKLPFLTTSFKQNIEDSELFSNKFNVVGHNMLFLDYESRLIDRWHVNTELEDFTSINFDTFSNGLKAGYFNRAILFLTQTISTSDFKLLKPYLYEIFCFGYENTFDITCLEQQRRMYLPCLYDGIRNPNLELNVGYSVDLTEMLNEIKAHEKERTELLKLEKENQILVYCLLDEFDRDKQLKCLEIGRSNIIAERSGTTHASIWCETKRALEYGIDASEILSNFEPLEGKNKGNIGYVQRVIDDCSFEINPYARKVNTDIFKTEFKKHQNKIIESPKIIDKNSLKININEKISVFGYIISDIINLNKFTYLECPPKSGKTHFAIKELKYLIKCQNIIIAEPSTLLVDNISGHYGINGIKQDAYFNSDKIQVCTYNAVVDKYDRLKRKDTILVIDEAHILITDYNFRYKTINSLISVASEFKKVIFLSGTPLYSKGLGENICKIKIEYENKEEDVIHTTYYSKQDQIIHFIKEKISKGSLNMIFINDKNEHLEYESFFTKLGYKCMCINANNKREEDIIETMESSEIPKDVEIILCTSIIQYGINIKNKIDNIFIVSEINALEIRQLVDRDNRNFENNELKNIYLFLKEKNGIYKKYIKKLERFLLIERLEKIINEIYTIPENKIFERRIHITKKIVEIDTLIHLDWKNNKYKIDSLGIDNRLYKEETTFLYQNLLALSNNLKKYGFKHNNIYLESNLSKEDKKDLKNIHLDIKEKKKFTLDTKIKILFGQEPEFFKNKAIVDGITIYKEEYDSLDYYKDELLRLTNRNTTKVKRLMIDSELKSDKLEEMIIQLEVQIFRITQDKEILRKYKFLKYFLEIENMKGKQFNCSDLIKTTSKIFNLDLKNKSKSNAMIIVLSKLKLFFDYDKVIIHKSNNIHQSEYRFDRYCEI